MCICFLLLFFLIKLPTLIVVTQGLYIENIENTEFIQQRVGYDIKLECDLKGLVEDDKITNVQIRWYFMQCADSANNCHAQYDDEWMQLPCENNTCKPHLQLHNVTEKYSGLYKCTVTPFRVDTEHALDIQLVRTYQIDVQNTSVEVPAFISYHPQNRSAIIGSQVVFQCRVHSVIHPTIRWFHRTPYASTTLDTLDYTNNANSKHNFNGHFVQHNGHTYKLLSSSREKFISDNVYMSKLILNAVRKENVGYYACVAINYRGHSIREAYLQIISNVDTLYAGPNKFDDDVIPEERTDPSEFWLLFLMPLGLALLPAIVWFCYVIYKRCKKCPPQCSDKEKAASRSMLNALF